MIINNSIFICTEPMECAIKLAEGERSSVTGVQVYCNTNSYSLWVRIKLGWKLFWLITLKKSL